MHLYFPDLQLLLILPLSQFLHMLKNIWSKMSDDEVDINKVLANALVIGIEKLTKAKL